jgi:hypothetical protein
MALETLLLLACGGAVGGCGYLLLAPLGFWYAVESNRVDGKPRIVRQRYLGKADEVIARLLRTG